MRTTTELIAELQAVGQQRRALLVVAFKTETKLVYSDHPNALNAVNAMVIQGGMPLGFVQLDGNGAIRYVVLKDHSGEAAEIAKEIIEQILNKLYDEFESQNLGGSRN